MPARANLLPSDALSADLRERLAAAGFRLVPTERSEEVYARAHDRDPRYTIHVYTSIPRADGPSSHETAIRVLVLHADLGPHPIFRSDCVRASGPIEGVLDRVIERVREAYATINRHRREVVPTSAGAETCRRP
jgi:hypothetical protein